jgi:hypothetical protein
MAKDVMTATQRQNEQEKSRVHPMVFVINYNINLKLIVN